MTFVRESKRRKLSSRPRIETDCLASHDADDPEIAPPADFNKRAVDWDLEQRYERQPRHKSARERDNLRLPIKTAEGRIEQVEQSDDRNNSEIGSEVEESQDEEPTLQVLGENIIITARQQILNAKEDLAKFAGQINEDPEENVGCLRTLRQIASSPHPIIKKFALATQMTVYRDVIPGYRIRPPSGMDTKEKLSKEVKKLRNFEQSLLGTYQLYLKDLASFANPRSNLEGDTSASIASTATACACTLLLAVPHFNYREELLKIVIEKCVNEKFGAASAKCVETLETLFQDDEDGTPSLEAVSMLTKLIKRRSHQIDEKILNIFLHLRLLSEFSSKASQRHVDKAGSDGDNGRKLKSKREFRSKKQRKVLKEQKKVEREFREADAIVGREHRDQMQAETLKVVFGTYFRILKARDPHLTGAVLEGLAKYAHLISQEFFGDLLEVLKDLIRDVETILERESYSPDNEDAKSSQRQFKDATRSTLLCVTTAFALLEGQDVAKSASSLGLDLTFFITCLYRSLHGLALNPNIEDSSKAPRLSDPVHRQSASTQRPKISKVNVQTTVVLLLRALSSAVIPRSTPPVRLAAFTKQLYTSCLHFPEKASLATLGLLNSTAKGHTRKIAALWNTEERKGDGVFNPLRAEIDSSNPFASTIWEGELLRCHFCPSIRDASKGIELAVRSVS